MGTWTRWSLKLLMLLLALSGFAAGADDDLALELRGSPGVRMASVAPDLAWHSMAQAMNPPMAAFALLLGPAADGGSALPSATSLHAAADLAPPCESSAGLLLLGCLLAPVLWRRCGPRRA